MEIVKDLKATIYDFFGYLLPGSLLIFIIVFSYYNGLENEEKYSLLINMVKNIKLSEIIVVIIVGYILGHVVSAMSSLVHEKGVLNHWKKLRNSISEQRILTSQAFDRLKIKFKDQFGYEYSSKDFQEIVVYVEANKPSIYQTAFVFLSFYGMARNCSFVCLMGFIIEVYCMLNKKFEGSWQLAVGYIILATILFYHFYRFNKYYKERILIAFLQ